MIKVLNKYPIATFEYLYMVVMIVYTAQMTGTTARMVGGLSGNPIPFLIPIVLTIVLLARHRISFDNSKLYTILLLFLLWSICVLIKNNAFFVTQELSYHFFLFYGILIAYIHVRVFRKKIFYLYEDIMVKMSCLPILFWLIGLLLPELTASFFHQFPETAFGNNFMYIYNWMDPLKGQIYSIPRNAGFSWEPGRYAIMLTLAICFNLYRNGIRFHRNWQLIVLLIALTTTQSTTGYVTAIILFLLFYIKKLSMWKLLGVALLCPVLLLIANLDFMSEKVSNQFVEASELTSTNSSDEERFIYAAKTREEGEYAASLERFTAMYFEWGNVKNDPVIGYGLSTKYSHFYKKISTNFVLTSGILKIFGQYGIPIGLLIYLMAFYSSVAMSRMMLFSNKYAFFFWLVMSSVSYVVFLIPVFTAFWLWGVFCHKSINVVANEKLNRYKRALRALQQRRNNLILQ